MFHAPHKDPSNLKETASPGQWPSRLGCPRAPKGFGVHPRSGRTQEATAHFSLTSVSLSPHPLPRSLKSVSMFSGEGKKKRGITLWLNSESAFPSKPPEKCVLANLTQGPGLYHELCHLCSVRPPGREDSQSHSLNPDFPVRVGPALLNHLFPLGGSEWVEII